MLYDCVAGAIYICTFSQKKKKTVYLPKMYIITNKKYLEKYGPKITILKPYILLNLLLEQVLNWQKSHILLVITRNINSFTCR